jgi:hypothetical protein
MNHYNLLRNLLLKGKFTQINQLLKRLSPEDWSQILRIGPGNARKKVEKKGTTLILRDAYSIAEFFNVDAELIIDLIQEQQQHLNSNKIAEHGQ